MGLRYLLELVDRRQIPRPRVIYLDTAHEYPETVLELRLAFQLLAPGGILTGKSRPTAPSHPRYAWRRTAL